MKQKTDKFDIFISYRRDGGVETARLLYDRLTHAGYRVSFDMETLRSGKFNAQLYNRIEECQDVVVLLSKNALELRANPEDDWLRLEIAHAFKNKKNIIPVFLRDFVPPKKETLPDDIAELMEYEAVTASDVHFDSTFSMLCRLLHAKPYVATRQKIMKMLWCGLALLLLICVSAGYIFRAQLFPFPFTHNDKQLVKDFIANIQLQGYAYNELAEAYKALLDEALNSVLSGSSNVLQEEYARFLHSWNDISLKNSEPSETLKNRILETPIDPADFSAHYDSLKDSYKRFRESGENLMKRLDKNSILNQSEKLKIIKLNRDSFELVSEIYTYGVMAQFLKVSPAAYAEFKSQVATYWRTLPLLSEEWIRDEKTMNDVLMQKVNALDANLKELATFLGNQTSVLRDEKRRYEDNLIAMGATAEQAKEIVEKTLSNVAKGAQVKELTEQLQKKKQDLAELHEKMKKKFAPLPTDDPGILWGKALRFISVKLYDAALNAVSVLRQQKSSQFPEPVCRAAEAYIKLQGGSPITNGVMVCFFEPPATSHAIFQLGDIVTAVNGKPCTKTSEYNRTKGNKLLIWRLNEKGVFISHEAIMPDAQPRAALVNLTEVD